MANELTEIVGNFNLCRYDTKIDQVHRLNPDVESHTKGSMIPLTTLGWAVKMNSKPGDGFYDTFMLPSIGPLRTAYDGCDISELAGKPIRVYYQGSTIIGVEPLQEQSTTK